MCMDKYISSSLVYTFASIGGAALYNEGVSAELSEEIIAEVVRSYSQIDIKKGLIKVEPKVTTKKEKKSGNLMKDSYQAYIKQETSPEWIIFDSNYETYYCKNILLPDGRYAIADNTGHVFSATDVHGVASNLSEMDKIFLNSKGIRSY